MNLNNFQDYVSAAVLESGMDSYINHAVADLQGFENGQFFAIVEDTKDYQVDIKLDDTKTILDYRCNCPNKRKICKHIVAVLYDILDE